MKLKVIASVFFTIPLFALAAGAQTESKVMAESQIGGGESVSAVQGRSSATDEIRRSGKAVPNSMLTSLQDCSLWYLTGSNNWKWRGGSYAFRAELNANSSTFYGAPSDPEACGRPPLSVDRIMVRATIVGGSLALKAENTAYNTNYVEASDRGYHVGSGSTPCGAYATHESEKWGVVWNNYSKSGCSR